MYFHSTFSKPIEYPEYPRFTLQEIIDNTYGLSTFETPIYEGIKEFSTLDDAVNAIRTWGIEHDVVIRKGSGNNKLTKNGVKRKVILVCQCSGKQQKLTSGRKSRIMKTECPFRINLNFRTTTNTWNITKMILDHNHS